MVDGWGVNPAELAECVLDVPARSNDWSAGDATVTRVLSTYSFANVE